MAGAVGSHLPSTWADRLRSPDRHSDPALDCLTGPGDYSHRQRGNEIGQRPDYERAAYANGYLPGGGDCVRIGAGTDLGGGGAGGPANGSFVVVFAVPFRRFLAASRLEPHAQPVVLRRAARPGRHTLYGADRSAHLFRLQPA